MIIVFVFDQYDDSNNGTTVSMRRFVEQLRQRGHEVRVLSTGKEESFKYVCPSWKAGFGLKWAEKIISSHGMAFGYGKEDVIWFGAGDLDTDTTEFDRFASDCPNR